MGWSYNNYSEKSCLPNLCYIKCTKTSNAVKLYIIEKVEQIPTHVSITASLVLKLIRLTTILADPFFSFQVQTNSRQQYFTDIKEDRDA